MTAYYNEFDPFAAGWLRNLIAAGHIAAGDVDSRSITEVSPDDLRGYDQVHLFAGIGGWPYAFRLAGWPDDEPVWSASCPCPPFSSAGKSKACPGCGGTNPVPCPRRTGFFICSLCGHAWFADERHLWPEVWRLVRDRRPSVVFGEQVASADGRTWLAGVRASLEILAYANWGGDLCAAGAGAPNIRQRLFWVGDTLEPGLEGHAGHGDVWRQPGWLNQDAAGPATATGDAGGMADAASARRDGALGGAEGQARDEARVLVPGADSADGRLGDADEQGSQGRRERGNGTHQRPFGSAGVGPWDEFDVIAMRDGKARRIEPGSCPLAHGVPARVGRLRGYGNAINPWLAKEVILTWAETGFRSA